MEKTVILLRVKDDKNQTKGFLSVLDKFDSPNLLLATLELPWRDNQSQLSCIPPGEYICKAHDSPSFGNFKDSDRGAYLILNVPNRSLCLFHPANYVTQLRGCVAVGLSFADLNNDGVFDLVSSRKAMKKFKDACGQEFKLIIKNAWTQPTT